MLVLASFEDLLITGRVAAVVIYPEKWLTFAKRSGCLSAAVWIVAIGDPGEPDRAIATAPES
jgi:hypothetical protein